ncbi:MAG: homoserine dehydrogenase [Lachnospiraceae bacterium]|jgi:homoserine dehydrogenase|nr:homoserine dehydrogenase [Lachnospiraceae bacterium]CCZ27368.1 homoserine dehydrogenase [Firmicutes bacterium CAG:194]HCI18359.1 homoserine dehydrogenase [Lachnospiraceae bacterium]HCX42314.1 homoserine dehydrogenase [Lachnospiraceae bacterium]
MVKVAVLGYGTVGSGIVEVIKTNQDMVNKKAGDEIDVKYILDLRDFPGDPYENLVVHDVEIILNDPEVLVIAEAMGGVEPAYTFTKRALSAGKSVCTSNKELVAKHGAELIELARANKCNYMFEASVGGGIPIIRPLNASLTPERVDGITGILNGTTNYILTKMEKEGSDFDTVLKEAQDKGYAERNPEADVEGYDACRKIAILSSLIYGKNVNFEHIYTEGITKITTNDFAYAKKAGYTIKLLAMSKEVDGKYFAMVTPCMINDQNPLYFVNDVFNGILVHGNTLGNTMYYGAGAGKLPTASAVVSDIIDCVKHLGKTVFCFWDKEELTLSSMDDSVKRFFVRVKDADFAKAKEVFGDVEEIDAQIAGEKGFFTQAMSEKAFKEKSAQVGEIISRIRVEE